MGGDGRPVFESYTGAYAVKIMIDGKWQVVIVDDFFPALEASKAGDEDSKGLAVGHSYGARELWVSLLEKVRLDGRMWEAAAGWEGMGRWLRRRRRWRRWGGQAQR